MTLDKERVEIIKLANQIRAETIKKAGAAGATDVWHQVPPPAMNAYRGLFKEYNLGVDVSSFHFWQTHRNTIRRAAFAVPASIRVKLITDVFSELERSVWVDGNKPEEVPIPVPYTASEGQPDSFFDVFAYEEGLFRQGLARAFPAGIQDILTIIDPSTPKKLVQYSRTDAHTIANMQRGETGEDFFITPTSLPDIDVRYSYPQGQITPSISLLVNPISFTKQL